MLNGGGGDWALPMGGQKLRSVPSPKRTFKLKSTEPKDKISNELFRRLTPNRMETLILSGTSPLLSGNANLRSKENRPIRMPAGREIPMSLRGVAPVDQ